MQNVFVCALCLSFAWMSDRPVLASESAMPTHTIDGREVVGWVEFVTLEPHGIIAKAKLDTGAMTSSLHAEEIEFFHRDGQRWVRFEFNKKARPPKHGMPRVPRQERTIEAPVKRTVRIKQHTVDFIERPAVDLEITLGDKTYRAEFTLTNRDSFIYPVLLGRRFLETALIVDPARIHVTGAPPALLDAAKD